MNILNISPFLQVGFTFITSFLICFLSIPSVIKIAELKNLYDEPCDRKRHNKRVPTFGGIAIFAGFIISTTFWAKQGQIKELQYIITSIIILFFIGIKDDVVNLIAKKKLLGQVIAAAIVVLLADIRLSSMYGIFNVYDIPYWFSCCFSIFTIIAITNSFNLIDGVDTLAGSIGTLSCSLLAFWFYQVGHMQYSIVAVSMTGALIAFLKYNKTPASIFMGDTGSLILGLVISILTIKFIEFNRAYIGPIEYQIKSVPAVAIGILIIPIFDTARVIILRILEGRSPLSSDRNHIHHILTDLGLSHIRTTSILVILNLFIVMISLALQSIMGELLLFINFSILFLFTAFITRKNRVQIREQKPESII